MAIGGLKDDDGDEACIPYTLRLILTSKNSHSHTHIYCVLCLQVFGLSHTHLLTPYPKTKTYMNDLSNTFLLIFSLPGLNQLTTHALLIPFSLARFFHFPHELHNNNPSSSLFSCSLSSSTPHFFPSLRWLNLK